MLQNQKPEARTMIDWGSPERTNWMNEDPEKLKAAWALGEQDAQADRYANPYPVSGRLWNKYDAAHYSWFWNHGHTFFHRLHPELEPVNRIEGMGFYTAGIIVALKGLSLDLDRLRPHERMYQREYAQGYVAARGPDPGPAMFLATGMLPVAAVQYGKWQQLSLFSGVGA
jgi:hypothetical protein